MTEFLIVSTTFNAWVMRARVTDNPAGDLIGDIQRDTRRWARAGIDQPPLISSVGELSGYLHRQRACSGAVAAVPAVWKRFQNSKRRINQ
jgi:hypothetical protein